MHRMIWAALLLLAAYSVICLWAGMQLAAPPRRSLQDYHRDFLTHPSRHGVSISSFTTRQKTPCLMVQPLPDGVLSERGQRIRDQLLHNGVSLPQPGAILGTLVLAHGRKGRKEDYLLIAERLCAVGFRCLLFDLPGHGEHPSDLATYGIREAGLPAEVLQEAAEQFQFQSKSAALLGMSMGGAVAIRSAATEPNPWMALAIISSFDRLEIAVEQTASEPFGPAVGRLVTWGAGKVYHMITGFPLSEPRSDDFTARLQMPTLIAHGSKDRVIPMSSGKRLYDSLPKSLEKRWIEVPDADHDNVLITDFPIYAKLAEWMLKHVKS